MRKCPSCGYGNSDAAAKCGICARDISAVPVSVPPAPPKESYAMPAAGLLILACGAFYFFMQNSPWRGEPPPVSGENAATDESSFSYAGVLFSLERMSGLGFLSEADKLRVLKLIQSPDYLVSQAAVKLVGEWARNAADDGRRRWFETLLDTAESSSHISSRHTAALEAGTALALGFPPAPYQERVRRLAVSLSSREEVDLKAGGFFLAAAAGLREFEPEFRTVLESDRRTYVKLYAACGLSRFGSAEGDDYLFGMVSGGTELQEEAVYCAAFSASPAASRLLSGIAKSGTDNAAAEAAKRSLNIRKQLAIIKK